MFVLMVLIGSTDRNTNVCPHSTEQAFEIFFSLLSKTQQHFYIGVKTKGLVVLSYDIHVY